MMRTASIDDVETRVIEIIKSCTNLPEEKMDRLYWSTPLTGASFSLSAVDMVYIFLELEKEFQVTIPPQYLQDYGFCCIEKICGCIAELTCVSVMPSGC